MNYWTNLFNTEVGTLDPDEAPLIIAALEELASTYKKTVPGAGNIADTFRKNTKKPQQQRSSTVDPGGEEDPDGVAEEDMQAVEEARKRLGRDP